VEGKKMVFADIVIILAILFLIALIITPIYLYFEREKYVEDPKEESENASED
jgi:hypothetical protein